MNNKFCVLESEPITKISHTFNGYFKSVFKANSKIIKKSLLIPLCEKCPNTEFFVVRIRKNMDQKKLRI